MDQHRDAVRAQAPPRQSTRVTAPEAPPANGDASGRILRERARLLARPPRGEDEEGTSALVVEFILAGERYALDAQYVHEVAPLGDVVPLPGAPEFVMGIISLRGEIQSVVDLRRLFDLPADRREGRSYAVILRGPDMEFGLYADEVPGVGRLALDTMLESLPTLTGLRQEFLNGVTGEGVVYLDAARLLSDERITMINS